MGSTGSRRSAVATLAIVAALLAATLTVPASASAADSPNSCSTAAPASSKGAWLSDSIASASDVDWFRFTTTSSSRTIVTLGHLAADYDLYLYSGCSTLIASSHRNGRQFDEIYASLAAGTYLVKVIGYAGAESPTPYALRFRPVPWGISVLSSSTWTDSSGYLHIVGEVLNNTADYRRWIEVDAALLSSAGASVGSAVGYSDVPTLAPWSRSPFEIVAKRPAGYAKATLRVCSPSSTGACAAGQVATPGPDGLQVTSATSTIDASGRRHYSGTVTNGGTATAYLTRSVITLYDSYGNVTGLGNAALTPSTLAVGDSGTFEIVGSGTASPNRSAYAPQASRRGCASTPRYVGAQENLVPPLSRPTAAGRVALTFDMGGRMDPAVQILNLLIANRVCATIFPTGAISRTAQGQAALAVIKLHQDLFELGNHTMHHCDLVRGGGGSPSSADAAYCDSLGPSPTEAQVKKELIDGDFWIRNYSGMSTTPFWRAPYGVINSNVLRWAAEVGWTKHFKWDVDTIDWRPIANGGPTARSMTVKVVNSVKSGSVVLMHLGGYETADALQSMIDGLRSRGYVLTTLSDLAR